MYIGSIFKFFVNLIILSVWKYGYPISTLSEHLHSTSLSYAETTLNSRKTISFPLIAHYLSAGPPHPPSPGDPATPTLTLHSHFQRPASHTCFWPLSLVMFASPLRLWNYRCFLLNWLYWHSVFHIYGLYHIYIYIRSAFYVFLWKGGGGGQWTSVLCSPSSRPFLCFQWWRRYLRLKLPLIVVVLCFRVFFVAY